MVRKVRHYLTIISKNIEKNEERLRLISSTLEHSTSVNTLRRKPSPCNSLGGSLSSINGLNSSHNINNLSNNSSLGTNSNQNGNKNTASLFGKNMFFFLIFLNNFLHQIKPINAFSRYPYA